MSSTQSHLSNKIKQVFFFLTYINIYIDTFYTHSINTIIKFFLIYTFLFHLTSNFLSFYRSTAVVVVHDQRIVYMSMSFGLAAVK